MLIGKKKSMCVSAGLFFFSFKQCTKKKDRNRIKELMFFISPPLPFCILGHLELLSVNVPISFGCLSFCLAQMMEAISL